ncbi:gp47 [Escherichia phage N4]|uniref:Gp47 n=1 Tax=Enterobacteria phage N4 TaxID=2886925 RepID=A0MZD6_BPN4|nr:gp47 [Escherichia phage N4]ABK54415.1 gp47 [Escherichia phage N4]
MQVILTQPEIEAALTGYVNDLMSVREGMEIKVTFKATRGDDGATAIVDIVPAGSQSVEVVEEPKKESKERKHRPVTQTNTAAVSALASATGKKKEEVVEVETTTETVDETVEVAEEAAAQEEEKKYRKKRLKNQYKPNLLCLQV